MQILNQNTQTLNWIKMVTFQILDPAHNYKIKIPSQDDGTQHNKNQNLHYSHYPTTPLAQ